ncbi:MAG TPA: hypothetical protein VJP45_12620 [Candidatus Limnocylindria bacterium]|nr:hypothetical protein [Candidatus Limnocylindria bacterium]
MKTTATLLVASAILSSSLAFAQGGGTKAPAKGSSASADTIYSWCVTRFDGGGQKEVFVSSVSKTADTIALRRHVEYRARTGANTSVAADADLRTECGSSRDKADALKKRDLKRAESTNVGYLLKPEIVYY